MMPETIDKTGEQINPHERYGVHDEIVRQVLEKAYAQVFAQSLRKSILETTEIVNRDGEWVQIRPELKRYMEEKMTVEDGPKNVATLFQLGGDVPEALRYRSIVLSGEGALAASIEDDGAPGISYEGEPKVESPMLMFQNEYIELDGRAVVVNIPKPFDAYVGAGYQALDAEQAMCLSQTLGKIAEPRK
jgi:hypothetical protein